MIVIIGQLTVSDDGVDQFERAARELVEHTRNETGCISYSIARDVNDPATFHISEQWADEDSLTAHVAADHFRNFRRSVLDVGISSSEVVRLDDAKISKLG